MFPPHPGSASAAAGATSRRRLLPHPDHDLRPALRRAVDERYRRIDRLVSRLLLLHLAFAFALAPVHGTWQAAILVGMPATAAFWWCGWMHPGRLVTRVVAGLSLQAFCALAIHQMRGMPEMHFFFFTSVAALVLYEDWRAIVPGVLAIFAQHLLFMALHDAGVLTFFDVPYMGWGRMTAHLGIASFHAVVASFGAEMLRRRTLEAAERERRIEESEARYRMLIERSPDMVVVQVAGAVRFANAAAQQAMGHPPGALTGTRVADHLAPEYHDVLAARMQALHALGPAELPMVEYELLTAAGERLPVEGTSVLVEFEGQPAVQHVLRDVRARRAGDRRFRAIADAIPAHVWVADVGGANVFVNRAVREFARLDASPAAGDMQPTVHPEQAAAVHARWNQCIATGEPFEAEARLLRHDGAWRWFLIRAEPIRDGTGAITEWVGTSLDIDDRREMEEALRESEESYRTLVDALPDGMLVHDGACIRYANAAAARALGARDPADLLGVPIAETCTPDYVTKVQARLELLRRGTTREALPLTRYELRRRDGTTFTAEMTTMATTFGGSPALVTVLRDITARLETERALDKQRATLHTLVQSAPYGIVSLDHAWRVTQMNPAAERIFGWKADDVVGGSPPWVSEPMRAGWEAVRGTLSRDPGRPDVVTRQRRDGRLVDCEIVELDLPPVDGAPAGRVAFFTDVTERRRAEEGLREFVQQASEGVWCFEFADGVPLSLDEDAQLARVYETGRLVRCNDAMARMYGYERAAELEGTLLGEMLPPTDPRNVEVLRHMVRHGYRFEGQETWEPDRHGALHCYSNNVVGIVQHGALLRVWGTQRDITAMKRAQTELEEALVVAEEERLLARTAQREAERASRAKSDFLAVMSHELRTPLNSVIGFATVLLRNPRGAFQPNEVGYLERIKSNGRHLLSLINDILDLSKIEAGRMDVRATRLSPAALVGEVLAELGGVAVTRGIGLRAELPDEPVELVADAGKLRQVLINLVGNALKFTSEGTVTVRVRAAPGQRVAIEVADTGIGIPPEDRERIFQAFQQAESGTARTYGGTGLGLAISRKLCELMDGTLSVESEVGRGSTFRVTLPADALAPALAG